MMMFKKRISKNKNNEQQFEIINRYIKGTDVIKVFKKIH